VWPAVDGYMMLHSGRPIATPTDGGVVVRREVVLDKRAILLHRGQLEKWRLVSDHGKNEVDYSMALKT